MTGGSDPREERLPKWAQEHIADLRRKAEKAEERATAARLDSGPADSDAIMDPYDKTPILLGKGTAIRFLLGDGMHTDVRVKQDRQGTSYLEVMGVGAAGPSLAVQPQASNVIRVNAIRD